MEVFVAACQAAGLKTLLVSGAFTDVGQLTIRHVSDCGDDYTLIEGNTSGDATADFAIKLRGHQNLTADDFQL